MPLAVEYRRAIEARTGGLRHSVSMSDVSDEAPKPVKEGVDREEADKLKADLEEAGAGVEVK